MSSTCCTIRSDRPPTPGRIRWPADKDRVPARGRPGDRRRLLHEEDGSKLDVEHDFHGRIGAPPCGPGAGPVPATVEAMELRQIVCEAAEAKLFNVALTPDYNWAHRNHFHLEVAAGVRWSVIR